MELPRTDPSDATASGAEREYVLVPHARAPAARVVGPGRRERAYLERLTELELALADAEGLRASAAAVAAERARALETAALIDRGATRRIDRLERAVRDSRKESDELAQRERRLILALGALQRENELLREQLTLSNGASAPALLSERAGVASQRAFARKTPQSSVWQRLLARIRGA